MTLEIKNGTYIIPEGFTAKIDGRKIVVEKKESEEEKIREEIITYLRSCHEPYMKEWISYLEKQKEQKPAEWSEEDEKMLNLCENFMKAFYSAEASMVRDWLKNRLKSLRPQPKAELDAVAEKEAYKDGFLTARYNSANAFMQYLDEHRPEGKMCLSNWECEDVNKAFEIGDWAKIIRYINKYQLHWKPSDEQIKTLENTIKCELSAGCYIRAEILQSLLRELKKL